MDSNYNNCPYSGPGLILYSAILAIAISQNMTNEEIDLFSNLLQAVGQNLGLISATSSICDTYYNSNEDSNINNNNENSQE